MKRAVPTIALSAAGLTWLLHAQGVIDTKATSHSTAASPTTTPASGAPPAANPGGGEGDGPPTTPTQPPRASPPTTRTPSSSGNRTVDGPVVDTRFGPVQVEVVVASGRITDIKALEYPNEARRSQFISEQALPMLHDEAVQAQSANIDTISGATYTSDAYAQSLQAALDSAGLSSQ